jgi:hypothetical protein
MTRRDQIRMFVLDVIADDYEEVEHIIEVVANWFGCCNLGINRNEIVLALISLTQDGLARGYHLMETPGNKPEEIDARLSPDQIQPYDPYFWITDKGREEVKLPNDGWPLDDDGLLRKDWVPPEY